jgi:AraC family transcriptional regulator
MDIYIKNMVCNRCITAVSEIFEETGFPKAKVKMGKVSLKDPPPPLKMTEIDNRLKAIGFELISDTKSRIIEQIKRLTIDFVYHNPEMHKVNFSEYLVENLHLDYNYISTLFSAIEGTTIEKHLIHLKIERVKELLVYGEKTLSEIAFELGYSSTAHLSGQFKKVTGFTPSYFKNLKEKKRKSIDQV